MKRSFFHDLWRLVRPFWVSEEKWKAFALLGLLLASRPDSFEDSLSIPVPVQRRLVKNPRAQSNSLHVIFR